MRHYLRFYRNVCLSFLLKENLISFSIFRLESFKCATLLDYHDLYFIFAIFINIICLTTITTELPVSPVKLLIEWVNKIRTLRTTLRFYSLSYTAVVYLPIWLISHKPHISHNLIKFSGLSVGTSIYKILC